MFSIIPPGESWPIWACMVASVAVCIYLEQTFRWAAKLSGPVVALLIGMALSNFRILPTGSPSYDLVDNYLVRLAVPLLLLRANVLRILRETGPMFISFHIATLGSVIGGFVAAFLFQRAIPSLPEVTGIMTASYVGGGVNFVAVAETYQIKAELTNPLLVADNFVMAGVFVMLLSVAGSRFFRRRYPHPHSLAGDQEDTRALAARYWKRKEISLLDIAKALGIAFVVAAASVQLTNLFKAQVDSKILESLFANPFVLITILSVTITTLFHRWTERIEGAEDLGMYLLYLFFVVIGLRADFVEVVKNMPVLFLFCLVIAATNVGFTLTIGRLFRLNLEELLLSVNATLGGPPSAAAMAISRGWSKLILPGLLAGIWGYVIGTFVGIALTEAVRSLFKG